MFVLKSVQPFSNIDNGKVNLTITITLNGGVVTAKRVECRYLHGVSTNKLVVEKEITIVEMEALLQFYNIMDYLTHLTDELVRIEEMPNNHLHIRDLEEKIKEMEKTSSLLRKAFPDRIKDFIW